MAESHKKSNAKYFNYPTTGFVSPVEHSLIYAMMKEPTIYPTAVIRQAIEEQDFDEFLFVNETPSSLSSLPLSETAEPVCSYAQLSALLSLAMQKWPPSDDDEPQPQKNEEKNDNPAAAADTSVPQVLCQALLRTVVNYAEQHNLDREHEVSEFLQPAVERTRQRLGRAIHTKFFLPYVAGAALSIATGNPLPLYLAYTGGMWSYLKDDAVTKEKQHALTVHKQSRRASSAETASLMDEMEDDF